MRFLLVGLGVVLAFAGYSWVWFDKAAELESMLQQRFEGMNQPGMMAEFQSVEVSGYPYRMEAVIDAPKISLIDDAGRITITADQVMVHSRPYSHDHIIATLDQNPQVTVHTPGGDQLLLSVTADAIAASFVQNNGSNRIAIDADNLVVNISGLAPHAIHDVQYHQRQGQEGAEFRLQLSHNEGDDQGIQVTGPLAISRDGANVYMNLTDARARYAGPVLAGTGKLFLQPDHMVGLEIMAPIDLTGWSDQCPGDVQAALSAADVADGEQDHMITTNAHVGLKGIQIGPAMLQGIQCSRAN